ncbi:MAG: hypothetical protein ABSF97_02515 [Candidatus Sulfotelmatobacter sp.]|jgi:hypothetical protein
MLKSDASGTQEHLEHLAQVRALAQSVADSISAIEQNDLKRFEIHLATQERLCNRLTGSKWILPSTARDEAVDGPAPRTSMPEEIRSAYIALGRLNRTYAALLRRVRKSAETIIALYRSHGEGYLPEPSGMRQRHTWSCEV